MAIGKIKQGKGFRGVLAYVLEEERATILDSNMTGTDPRSLAREFGKVRALRPNVTKAVTHFSISFDKSDIVSDQQKKEIIRKALMNLGYENNQYIAAEHHDTDHSHIHIIVNRITYGGKLVNDFQDKRKLEKSLRQIEKDYGLRQLQSSWETKSKIARLQRDEAELIQKTGKPTHKLYVQQTLSSILQDRPDIKTFIERCEALSIGLKPNLASTGKMNGFSFDFEGHIYTGSKLGNRFKWSELSKELGFDEQRDLPLLKQLKEKHATEQPTYEHEPPNVITLKGIPDPAPVQKKRRTLELTFARTADGGYVWKNHHKPAFKDHGDKITFTTTHKTAIKAALQLAQDKGWQSIHVKGNEAFRREMWLQNALLKKPMKFTGYEPTEADKQILQERLHEQRHRHSKDTDNRADATAERAAHQDINAEHRQHTEPAATDDRRPDGESYTAPDSGYPEHRPRDVGSPAATPNNDKKLPDRDKPVPTRSGSGTERSQDNLEQSHTGDAEHQRPNESNDHRSEEPTEQHGEHPHRDGQPDGYHKEAATIDNQQETSADNRNANTPDLYSGQLSNRKRSSITLATEMTEGLQMKHGIKDPTQDKAHMRTYNVVQSQVKAMDCLAYDIRVINQQDKKQNRKFTWKTEDLAKHENINFLKLANLKGGDVYIKPHSNPDSNKTPGLVLMDDLKAAQIEKLKKDGVTPSAIIETSPDNRQAWIRVSKEAITKDTKEAIQRRLSSEYGSNPRSIDAEHFGRLAGFTNRKEKHKQPNGYQPFVKLETSSPHVAAAGQELVETSLKVKKQEQALHNFAEQNHLQTDNDYSRALQQSTGQPHGFYATLYAYYVKRHSDKQKEKQEQDREPVDHSKADFYCISQMIRRHKPLQFIEEAMVASPGLAARKQGHQDDYIKRTIDAALKAATPEDKQAVMQATQQLKEQHERQQQRGYQPPKP